jgi:UDP:flavonoid glycosyltransferase YjiC (YdhE family)
MVPRLGGRFVLRIYMHPTGVPDRKESGIVLRRIYFAVFGSGLGHVTRVLDISERLRAEGDEFRYSCSAQALSYLKVHDKGSEILSSPPLDVEWTEEGSFSSKDFLPHFPLMFNSFLKQVAFEAQSIAKFDPRLVVSDSRLSPVLAARMKSYPVITMLNQFKVAFPPRFRVNRMGRFYERVAGDALGLLWSLSDQVLMTDLPPPYTIGEANIEGTDLSRIVRFVGFTSPRLELGEERLSTARRLLALDSRPLVFFQISGPDATKRRFVDTVLRSTDELAARYNVVVSLGQLDGSGEPRRLTSGAWLYDWCPIKDELFTLSDVVVARSGHGTIGQCIDAGKPAVLIPIHNHPEQIGNADKFCKLGLGLEIRSEDLNAAVLTEYVDLCLNDSRYRSNIEALMSVSKKYGGIEKCVEIIDSYG